MEEAVFKFNFEVGEEDDAPRAAATTEYVAGGAGEMGGVESSKPTREHPWPLDMNDVLGKVRRTQVVSVASATGEEKVDLTKVILATDDDCI